MLNVFLIASVILLIISIYLTILTIKQRRNLLRFKGFASVVGNIESGAFENQTRPCADEPFHFATALRTLFATIIMIAS